MPKNLPFTGHIPLNSYIYHSFLPITHWGHWCSLEDWMTVHLGTNSSILFHPKNSFHLSKSTNHTTSFYHIQSNPNYLSPCQFLSTNSIASLHLLSIENPSLASLPLQINLQTPSSPLYSLPFTIQSIFLQHQKIFQILHDLPPPWPHDHRIPMFLTPPLSMLNLTTILILKKTLSLNLLPKCSKMASLNPTQAPSHPLFSS